MIPAIPLESLSLCRLICGTNPFMGISHFTPSRDMFLQEYFADPATIAEIMIYLLEEFGVNACLSSPRDPMKQAIALVEKEYGEKYHWLCTPSARCTAEGIGDTLEAQIDWCAEAQVSVCLPHRSWTDAQLDPVNLRIRGLPEACAHIRDRGMIPGISTHYYECIAACNKQQYDVAVIIQPVNVDGFQSNIEVNTLIGVIQNTRYPIIAIKPLAAGRLLPEVGLRFTYSVIKPTDFVACGFDCLQNADYDAQLVEQLLR
jgi:hypothetical protein